MVFDYLFLDYRTPLCVWLFGTLEQIVTKQNKLNHLDNSSQSKHKIFQWFGRRFSILNSLQVLYKGPKNWVTLFGTLHILLTAPLISVPPLIVSYVCWYVWNGQKTETSGPGDLGSDCEARPHCSPDLMGIMGTIVFYREIIPFLWPQSMLVKYDDLPKLTWMGGGVY